MPEGLLRFKKIIAVALLSSVFFLYSCVDSTEPAFDGELTSDNAITASIDEKVEYIAHAGGVYLGYRGSNAMEALIDSAENGYNIIEVDITQTSDGYYVLNHDWESMGTRASFAENSPADLETFRKYKIYNKFTAVSLEDLIGFLDKYKNVRIITDTKGADYSSLYYIKENYGGYTDRFIPQAYAFDDYNKIREIGYGDVIVTLYEIPYEVKSDAAQVYRQAAELKPYAVTVPDELLVSEDYISGLHTSEIRYFAHTINNPERAEELIGYGIRGIYTDNLLSMDYVEYYNKKVTDINESTARLSDEQRAVLYGCLVYEYGSEICIEDGKASLIYDPYYISPFKNPVTQSVFLPLEKTVNYLGAAKNYRYIPESRAIAFECEDTEYSVSLEGFYKQGELLNLNEQLVCMNDIFNVPDKFLSLVCDCIIAEKDGYIIVSKDKSIDIDAITEVLRSIYGLT